MPELDALVRGYRHLHDFPRADEALRMIRKVASMVKPIMRARKWKILELTEFFPNEGNLLGLNRNKGEIVCLRLRYQNDRTAFLPFEEVVDTMLHELCHNVIGPHNEAFHALWNQLRDEHEALLLKGFTGQNFLSSGQRLGGGRMPQHEIRRVARETARQQQTTLAQQGFRRRLGGGTQEGNTTRAVLAAAAQRRQDATRMCSDRLTERQIIDLTESATSHGTMSAATTEEANEVAIAQALWELGQEDEKKVLGKDYAAPSQENPMGSGGKMGTGRRWACHVCTLVNPAAYLCCDACGSERSHGKVAANSSGSASVGSTPRRPQTPQVPETVDLTASPSPPLRRDKKRRRVEEEGGKLLAQNTTRAMPPTWKCVWCSTVMEQQWWTCTVCGRMKERS